MGPISFSTTIDAPRERVFEFLCDLAARPSWTDHFAKDYRIERIPATGVGAAARFRVNGPAGVKYMETVIAEAEPQHRIVEHARGGRLDRIAMRIVWEIREGPTTELTLTFWTVPGTMIDRIREVGRSRWWRRRWSKALRRLGSVIESGEEVPRVEAAGGDRLPSGVM